MPTYDYRCPACEQVFEVRHLMLETPTVICELCKSPSCTKLISSSTSAITKGKEIWEYNDVRKYKPKWLKSRDGKTRVRYDSSKHGYGKGR
jgi:putative FmdB family regulatory protein